jgi:ATP-dependent DNA ligase
MSTANARLRFIEPQLASPVDQPPEGKHWIHEIKHDGYRSQVVIERGKAHVFSRNEPLRESYRSMHWHLIALAVAELG